MSKLLGDYKFLNAAVEALAKSASLTGLGEVSLKPAGELKVPGELIGDFAAAEGELAALSEGERAAYISEVLAGEGDSPLSEKVPAVEAIFNLITGDLGAASLDLYSAFIREGA